MARAWLMILVFTIALLFFAIVAMPARVIIKEQNYILAGEQLSLTKVSGKLLQGTARWRWRELDGKVRWRLQQALPVPRIRIRIDSPALEAQGGIAVSLLGNLAIQNLALNADVKYFSEALALAVGGADGNLLGELEEVLLTSEGSVSAEGVINYSGGHIHWANGSATVGPLQLIMDRQSTELTHLELRASSSTELYMDGSINGRIFEWQVYRRWVQLLGMSQGGAADDVVFKISDQW